MPIGQAITLDAAYGSATVTRFFLGSGNPLVDRNTDLTLMIAAGQDIVLPGPYVEATGGTPGSDQPSVLVQPIPLIVVQRPDNAFFVYPAIVIGDRNFQGRLDYPTPIGIVEAGTMARAIMPAADLSLGGLYRAYLHFEPVNTAYVFFFVS